MNAEIISIGSELLAGRIADTNAAYLSAQLEQLGVTVQRHTAVGDSREHILDALRGAAGRAEIAVLSGGIGPTPDDITRQTIAEFCGVELVEVQEAAADLRRIFARLNRTPSPSNFIQARIPRGAEWIPNPTGTAAGFTIAAARCRFYSLPGVPSEMKLMFEQSILPRLRRISPGVSLVRCLQAYGLGESVIGERLKDFMGEEKNPEVATQANEGVITIRITARGADEAEAQGMVLPLIEETRARLGNVIFDTNGRPLNVVVAELLTKSSRTLALAESCTGGRVAAQLTDVPGSTRFFLEGAVTYSNQAKTRALRVPSELIRAHGAVSPEVAEAMARGMREASGADLALAVTGIAGPAGGTKAKPVGLVYFSLADASGAAPEAARFSGDRLKIRDRATKYALNMLRLYLLKRDERNG